MSFERQRGENGSWSAAADAHASQEELRLLEILRDRLDIGPLEAAAIERGARARHTLL